jgi:hypothetical protein
MIKVKIVNRTVDKPIVSQSKPQELTSVPEDLKTDILDIQERLKRAQKMKKARKIDLSNQRELPFERTKKEHQKWMKEIENAYKHDETVSVKVESEIDKVDITPADSSEGWRIVIFGLIHRQVDMAIFFTGKPDRLEPQICFNNFPTSEVENSVESLFELIKKFEKAIKTEVNRKEE